MQFLMNSGNPTFFRLIYSSYNVQEFFIDVILENYDTYIVTLGKKKFEKHHCNFFDFIGPIFIVRGSTPFDGLNTQGTD